jgi:Prephenate dehydrogenase
MSRWFADRLASEGYEVMLTGRTTTLRPEQMIERVDVVVVCVPISVTSATVRQYGPLLAPGKALILLAGESEETIKSALEATQEEVEVMLVHNLWGPQAATMKDKNAIVVRTSRSGMFCSEFEAFLYKHGADIFHDSPSKHDLLMGVGQKLPTMISVALAMTLNENHITSEDIASHCTLTSLYPHSGHVKGPFAKSADLCGDHVHLGGQPQNRQRFRQKPGTGDPHGGCGHHQRPVQPDRRKRPTPYRDLSPGANASGQGG